MNTRLKQFLAAENISQAQFADTIKVVRASVSHVLAGRNNPGYEFIKAIIENYPSLNIEWLLLGRGRMYRDRPDQSISEQSSQQEYDVQTPAPASGLLFPEDETIEDKPINTLTQPVQSPKKQRNISRVIVLFDDGTFQEM